MGDGGEVILFPKALDDTVEPPFEKQPRPRWRVTKDDPCDHRGEVKLDEASRRLYCSDCNHELDIFEWLWNYLTRWERTNLDYRMARQQLKQTHEELSKLERQVRNRRAAARRPGVLLTAGDARLLRDQFRALQSVVLKITRDREDALRQAHLHGWDPAKVTKAYRRLSDAVELQEAAEAPTDAAAPVSPSGR